MGFQSGWAFTFFLWLVVCAMYLLNQSLQAKYRTYRVKKGREQMNEWLAMVGKELDRSYIDGRPYSKDAVKKFLADCSVRYFSTVIDANKKEE